MEAILQLLSFLLVSWIPSGGLAYLLDRIPAWLAWSHPTKVWVAMILTGLAGASLVLLQMYVPELWLSISQPVQLVLGYLAGWFLGQVTHSADKTARAVASP